jgi:outer membrane autotransporter protein
MRSQVTSRRANNRLLKLCASPLALAAMGAATAARADDVTIFANVANGFNLDTKEGATVEVRPGVSVTNADFSKAMTATLAPWVLTNRGTISSVNANTVQLDVAASGVVNLGSITGSGTNAVTLAGGGSVDNRAGATISAGNSAVILGTSSAGAGTFTNAGTITQTGTAGDLVQLRFGGTATNLAGGTITANNSSNALSVGNGAVRTVVNSGTIVNTGTGFASGVLVQGGAGTVTNNAGGIIRGTYNGVYASATAPLTFTNNGLIEATGANTASRAVEATGGGTLVNTGTIKGTSGEGLFTARAATVTNSGTIQGATRAINFSGNFARTLNLDTGSVLIGQVQGGTGTDDLVLLGTGTEDISKFLAFETLSLQGSAWTLTGTGGFQTSAAVQSGTLTVNGTLTSPTLSVASGATIKGTGTVGGAASLANGGILAGQSGSLLTFNSLVLNDASNVNVALGAPSTSALFKTTGALALNGKLTVTNGGGFALGSYRLFDYGGALTNNGLTIQTLPSGFNPGDWSIDAATSGQVNLTVAVGPGEQYWDGSNNASGGVAGGRGGVGTWNAANTNWTNQAGTINAPWAGGIAVFGQCPANACAIGPGATSPAYTVTVDPSGISIKGIRTVDVSVTLSGGAIGLTGNSVIDVTQTNANQPKPLNISSEVNAAGDLAKTGLASLFLTGKAQVGGNLSVEGVMSITGAAAPLTVGGTVTVGGAGTSTFANRLLILGGSKLTSQGGSAGGAAATAGAIYIQRGGVWDAGANAIDVGASGVGMLNVYSSSPTNVSEVKASEIVLGRNAGGSGKLQVWGDATAGVSDGIVTAQQVRGGVGGGTVEFDNRGATAAYVFTPILVGNLSTTFLSGVTTLRNVNNYTGATTINGGTVLLDGASLTGTAVTVQKGVLGGKGSITGGVTFAATNTTLRGKAGDLLAMGSLVLGDQTVVDVTLGAPSNAALFNVGGALTLDGRLAVARGAGFALGKYRLFDYGGALTNNGLVIQTLPTGYNPGDWSIDTAIAGQVSLNVVQSAGEQFWDGANAAPGSVAGGRGGSGTWNAANTNWTNAAGTINAPWASMKAVFAAAQTAATVTVEGARTFTGLRFLGGADYTLNAGPDGSLVTTGALAEVATEQSGALVTTARIAAPIVGTGGITKTGAGTLILTGANTYAGGTSVAAGTLNLGGGGTSGSIAGDVAISSGATFAIDRSDASTFAGVFSGGGAFAKRGVGRLTLSGNSGGFAGTTTVQAGVLDLAGTLGGTLALGAGARLQGTGTAGAITVGSGGVLAPGNSIGTLNATSISFGPGAVYEVEANELGQADRISLTGSATITGGTVSVLAQAGIYAPATQYTIISAAGGVSGSGFTGVTSNLAFLTPSLQQTANAVLLTLTRNTIDLDAIGGTRNQRAAGRGLQSVGTGALYNAVLALDAPGARAAFDAVSGEIHASLRTALFDDSRFVREAVLHRLERAPESGLALWAEGFGDWGRSDGDGNAARLERASSGVFSGFDAALGDNWRIGLGGGYSRHETDLAARSSSGSLEQVHGLVYAGAHYGPVRLSFGAGYAHVSARTSRTAAFTGFTDRLSAGYGGAVIQGFGELGYRIGLGGGAIEPFARIAVVNVRTDGFAETGGIAALGGEAANATNTTTTLGLHFATPVAGRFSADARIGWQHAFGTLAPVSVLHLSGGAGFGVAGVPTSREAGVAEGGFTFQASRGLALWARYSGVIGEAGQNNAVKGGISLKF